MSVQIKEADTKSIANEYYDSDTKSILPLKLKKKVKLVIYVNKVRTKESKKFQLKSEVLNNKIIDAILGKIPHFNHQMGERSIQICQEEAPKRLNILPPVLVPVKLSPQTAKVKNEKELESETIHVAKILKKESYPMYGRDYKLELILKKLHSTFPNIESIESKRAPSVVNEPLVLPKRINSRHMINSRAREKQVDIDDLGESPTNFKPINPFQNLKLDGKPCVNRPELNIHPISRPTTAISIKRKSRKSAIPTPKSRQSRSKPNLISVKQRQMFETTSCQAISRMMKASFKQDFYQVNYEYYTAKRIQVTKNKIDGCLTKLVIKERRNLLHPEYKNPVAPRIGSS
ncbi:hypothetical protein HK103_005700 [Boothiomyces macroporosus]|uniref:Uncharacterized protein n=1 Tax=Boothiomyces macroporosus TaxID=261099 RepID=A0AAD5Y782_9FUNG|nr:hypothetical protein HK103_005700 [Boothiomyces macroporosus]